VIACRAKGLVPHTTECSRLISLPVFDNFSFCAVLSSFLAVTSRDVTMSKWILICSNCKTEFQHSQIDDVGMARLLLAEKPIIPIGQKCVCPSCGFVGLYQRADLRYRPA
jgi:hypothetical protein